MTLGFDTYQGFWFLLSLPLLLPVHLWVALARPRGYARALRRNARLCAQARKLRDALIEVLFNMVVNLGQMVAHFFISLTWSRSYASHGLCPDAHSMGVGLRSIAGQHKRRVSQPVDARHG